MKIVLVALNSKYIHTSLAPWYLKAALRTDADADVLELTINRDYSSLLRAVCAARPEILGFSCYIFNIDLVQRLTEDIKQIFPKCVIVWGGPEVSYNAQNRLRACPAVDYIVCGEGERPFAQLVAFLHGRPAEKAAGGCRIPGVTPRTGSACPPEHPCGNPPSPYCDELLREAAGRILYFESSRGCPFSCSYCLSSASAGVRFFPLAHVKRELLKGMQSEARQIKFVDRTFNCSPARAAEIVRFILEEAGRSESAANKNYHFEAAADLFDEALFSLLEQAPKGLFQLEIGIQSFQEQTLAAVNRKTDLRICEAAIRRLLRPGNVHVHLDLIAGLPLEGPSAFAESFNRVWALQPHAIQLGFLKLLHGAGLREEAQRDGWAFEKHPPYEVLETPHMDFASLAALKDVAECVERLYNSGRFARTLAFLVPKWESPFAFFREFAAFFAGEGGFSRSVAARELYRFILAFAQRTLSGGDSAVLEELLKFDYFRSDSAGNPPKELTRLPLANARELYAQNPGRRHFERFAFDPAVGPQSGPVTFCFDYARKDPVTGAFSAVPLP